MATSAELTGASSEELAEARAALVDYLIELHPTLSLRAGPLADAVLGPAADALAAVEHVSAAAAASLDPETALAEGGYDEEVLAAALAGRGIERLAAAEAAGDVALVFSDDAERVVPPGYRLRAADGTAYTTDAQTRLLTSGSTPLSDDELALVSVPGGGYAGVVAVTAAEAGASGNRPAGTALEAEEELDNQTAAYAATDLSGGRDEETDAALLLRLPAAGAPRAATSETGIAAVVQDAAENLSAVSVTGFGSEAMRRGRSVLTGQTPGRADAWVRSADQLGREAVRVTATLDDAGTGRWRYTLAAGDAPALVKAEKTLQAGDELTSAGYPPQSVTWGYDTSGSDAPPDVRSGPDAMFSVYATATVRFLDPDTSTSGLTVNVSTKSYDAVVRYLAGVANAQEAVEAADRRGCGGDCLVRAACPVLVSVTAAATVASGVELTAEEVAAAVAAAVNALGITSELNGAVVAVGALSRLPAGTALELSGWSGTVHRTDGTTGSVTGSSGLSVTTDRSLGLGPETVAFYCDPESVTATVAVA